MFEQVSLDLGGRKLTLETGKMARQAHGAIVARYGDSVVLATACMDNKATEKDFLHHPAHAEAQDFDAGGRVSHGSDQIFAPHDHNQGRFGLVRLGNG